LLLLLLLLLLLGLFYLLMPAKKNSDGPNDVGNGLFGGCGVARLWLDKVVNTTGLTLVVYVIS